MQLQSRIKSIIENLPERIGRPLTNVPFSLRLGTNYWHTSRAISNYDKIESSELNSQLLERIRRILQYAYNNVAFYHELYNRHKFLVDDFRSWDDWNRVPIVTKTDLQCVPIQERCALGVKGMKVNTGGTSGQPLEFCLDKNAFAREWAHMHYIWKAHGYRPQHLKLTFRGKHFDRSRALNYNAVHNEYVVNSSSSMNQILDAIDAISQRTVIRWVHGYPSLVAEFSHALAERQALCAKFRARLFGALLGSEYPAPMYRSVIEETLTTNVVSWYGHSEMSVLARETSMGVYEAMPTYGFTEAVSVSGSYDHRLICTSFYNDAHPFIRYDTGDLIEPVSMVGGSFAFRISEGRVGDFILDRHGNRYALTAIIFGRHHPAFEFIQHLQIRDEGLGSIALMVTLRNPSVDLVKLRLGFDLDDLDIDWRIEVVDAPIRTNSGKIRLKV